jgi:hypothetical protein
MMPLAPALRKPPIPEPLLHGAQTPLVSARTLP